MNFRKLYDDYENYVSLGEIITSCVHNLIIKHFYIYSYVVIHVKLKSKVYEQKFSLIKRELVNYLIKNYN